VYDPRAVPLSWKDIAKLLAIVSGIWGVGAMVHANTAYDMVLSCDRGADVCTVTRHRDFWDDDERERFRPSDYLSLTLKESSSDGESSRSNPCLLLKLRAEEVSICEPDAAHPYFTTPVQRYFTDPEQMTLQATLSKKVSGHLAILFFGALSLPFLYALVLGLWDWIRPRKPPLPTGREGIGSRR
jgi:hypothetical protein